MANEYSKETILKLIERRLESPKVDYKSKNNYELELNNDPNYGKSELPKDVSAMANTITSDPTLSEYGIDENLGFIIVGADENGHIDDITQWFTAKQLDSNEWQQKVNSVIDPPVEFQFVPFDHTDQDGKEIKFGAIIIRQSTTPPHRFIKDVKAKKSEKIIHKVGSCYIREGTRTREANEIELERMYVYRASFHNKAAPQNLELYKPSDSDLSLLKVFVPPQPKPWVEDATEILNLSRFLLIHGPTGIGKKLAALRIANGFVESGRAKRILVPIHSIPVSEILGAKDSVAIIPDAYDVLNQLTDKGFVSRDEFRIIERLQKNNYLILTANDSNYNEILGENLLDYLGVDQKCIFELKDTSYSAADRRQILHNHVVYAHELNRISKKQLGLIVDNLEKTQSGLSKSVAAIGSPLAFKRFTDRYLHTHHRQKVQPRWPGCLRKEDHGKRNIGQMAAER